MHSSFGNDEEITNVRAVGFALHIRCMNAMLHGDHLNNKEIATWLMFDTGMYRQNGTEALLWKDIWLTMK